MPPKAPPRRDPAVRTPGGAGLARGPVRSDSIDSYLKTTRVGAAVAVLALIGGIVSDSLAGHFWSRNALLAGLASSVIVALLSVALVNEALERRKRQRWSVLAQYVMLQLVRNARGVWMAVVELARLRPSGDGASASVDDAAELVRDTSRLTEGVRGMVGDGERRQQLRDRIARSVSQSDALLGRWAGVMLGADAYAEIIDRHVELAADVAWVGSLLASTGRPDHDDDRRLTPGSSRIDPPQGELDDTSLADKIVAITQLAEQLDRSTLQFALRIVPVDWWEARLATTAEDDPS